MTGITFMHRQSNSQMNSCSEKQRNKSVIVGKYGRNKMQGKQSFVVIFSVSFSLQENR